MCDEFDRNVATGTDRAAIESPLFDQVEDGSREVFDESIQRAGFHIETGQVARLDELDLRLFVARRLDHDKPGIHGFPTEAAASRPQSGLHIGHFRRPE